MAGDYGSCERVRGALHKHNVDGGDAFTHIIACPYLTRGTGVASSAGEGSARLLVGLVRAQLSRLIAAGAEVYVHHARMVDFIHQLSHGQTGRQARLWAMHSL